MGRLIAPAASSPHVRAVMRSNRSRDTKPELLVRQLLSELGYRYRLYRTDLPGKPDIVFPGRRKVIFVHGCFWHQHRPCPQSRPLKSNLSYWTDKLARNKTRDVRNRRRLRQLGWSYVVIWECELGKPTKVRSRLKAFLK